MAAMAENPPSTGGFSSWTWAGSAVGF